MLQVITGIKRMCGWEAWWSRLRRFRISQCSATALEAKRADMKGVACFSGHGIAAIHSLKTTFTSQVQVLTLQRGRAVQAAADHSLAGRWLTACHVHLPAKAPAAQDA